MTDPLLDRLMASIEAGQSVALVTVVRATGVYAGALGKRTLVWPDQPPFPGLELGAITSQVLADARRFLVEHKPQLCSYKTEPDNVLEVFIEVQRRPPCLLIVGAGHVALPLARLGKVIDFEVAVLDDRPKFANEQRFPMADHVLAQPFRETLRRWPIDQDTYIVLVTRGHSHDVDCLLEVIDSPARYIGMIGSKRRIKAVFDLLEREQGVERAKFDRVYAPVGLDIGAENPAEIAVSIISEIIKVYRGGRAVSLSDTLRANRRLPLHPGRRS